MKTLFLALGAALALSACVPSPEPSMGASFGFRPGPVQDANPGQMANCTILQQLQATEKLGMWNSDSGLVAAQANIRGQVASLGGTHVVWGAMRSVRGAQTVNGTAYQCPEGAGPNRFGF